MKKFVVREYAARSAALLSTAFMISLAGCSSTHPGVDAPSTDDDTDAPETEPVPAEMTADAAARSEAGFKDARAVVAPSDAGTSGIRSDSGGSADPTEAEVVTSSDPSQATKAWWAYERPATYEVATSNVKVPTRDGTLINCKLNRPAKGGAPIAGKLPGLVVEFTPYVLQDGQYANEASYFVKRGYNALVCLLRGVGGSGGTWQHAFASQDGRDASDLVEWLAVQPFSDGRIGMFGESYGGQTTYGAAVEQPAHLRAIAPMQSPANLYDDVLYPGGIESVAGGAGNFWPIIAQLMSLGAISAEDEFAIDHAHPTFDEFWQDRTLIGRHQKLQVPVLAFGGWIDNFFRSGMLDNIEGALERTWTIYGQWVHTIPVDLGTCEDQCAPDPVPGGVVLAWFDHWVMEMKDVPIPARPTFLSFEGGAKDAARGWRELSPWLPDGSQALRYVLGADGSLAETDSTSSTLQFRQPAEANQSALTFSTAALEVDRVLLGRALLDFRAKLSASDANFYVTLLDVDSMGTETLVNDGYLKASHRASHTTPTPVPAGELVDYHITIRAQHYRFAAGHRLRIRIWGGPKDVLVQTAPVDVSIETGSGATLTVPGFAAD